MKTLLILLMIYVTGCVTNPNRGISHAFDSLITRPVQTNCITNGNYTTCTSR